MLFESSRLPNATKKILRSLSRYAPQILPAHLLPRIGSRNPFFFFFSPPQNQIKSTRNGAKHIITWHHLTPCLTHPLKQKKNYQTTPRSKLSFSSPLSPFLPPIAQYPFQKGLTAKSPHTEQKKPRDRARRRATFRLFLSGRLREYASTFRYRCTVGTEPARREQISA